MYSLVMIHFQVATEKDFIDAVNKVIKAYAKFSSTPRYMTYNWTLYVLYQQIIATNLALKPCFVSWYLYINMQSLLYIML